ncbi:MAG: hypothetical protein Q8O67_28220 [Deltaproteobacteria bacterium]|nr:hypothetical protein [Deltaproteobacteria bacterium]
MTVIETARRERDTLMMTAPSPLRSPLLSALLTLHRALSSSTATVDPGLDHARRLCRAAGRRLEDLLDRAEEPGAALLVSRFVEPDLLPLTDALAVFIGRCARARFNDADPSNDDLQDIGDAVAVVVEEDLGPALLSLGLFSFEVPRPFASAFDPRRHQLVERAAGPKDVVVDVQRFGRVGAGGRLKDPALVVVGGGS